MARRNLNSKSTKRTTRSREEMPELESDTTQDLSSGRSSGRSTGGTSNGRRNSREQSQGSQGIDFRGDYKDILRELAASPTVRYVAGGIAAALLTRLANNWEEKYPEISTFIRENVDTLEGKFGSNRVGMGDSVNSRH